MRLRRASRIHDPPDHHYTHLSPGLVAHRLFWTRDFQHGILAPAVLTSCTVDRDLWSLRREVLGPIPRCSNRASALGLVEAWLVLYPVFSLGGRVVPLQHCR